MRLHVSGITPNTRAIACPPLMCNLRPQIGQQLPHTLTHTHTHNATAPCPALVSTHPASGHDLSLAVGEPHQLEPRQLALAAVFIRHAPLGLGQGWPEALVVGAGMVLVVSWPRDAQHPPPLPQGPRHDSIAGQDAQ